MKVPLNEEVFLECCSRTGVMMIMKWGYATIALAMSSLSLAQNGSQVIDGQSNIFGYGVTTPAPAGGGGGVLAPVVTLDPGVGRILYVQGLGGVSFANNAGAIGADGEAFNSTINGTGPVSGVGPIGVRGGIFGVFIEDGDISGLTAPANFSQSSLTEASYAPGLRQVFFIGDGYADAGQTIQQQFFVPDGASKLVFGIADAFSWNGNIGWYGDNTGDYLVEYAVTAVPEPASMIALGVGALALVRRRRTSK